MQATGTLSSILPAVDKKIAELLGIPDHSEFGAVPRLESKKSAQFLGEERNRKPGIGARLVSETYLLIESNWKHPDRNFLVLAARVLV
jgi:hypothetical protein